jgi:hypothetical protein
MPDTTLMDTYTPDNLIAGDKFPIDFKGVTIVSGAGKLARGTVIGIITASGKGNIVDSTKSDGTQTAKYILADAVDATSADVVAQCYQSGEFNRKALIFGGTDTAAKHEDTLRQYGIYLKDNIAY